jgi:tetratricopeptide (TPR) repeat protein
MISMSERTHMSGTWRWWVLVGVMGLVGCRTTGSAVREDRQPARQEIQFEPVEVTADLELIQLNDKELFAKGTAAFGAQDYQQAARYFGRLADFYPHSSHLNEALYNAGLSHRQLKEWVEAYDRFSALADAEKGQGDALEAAFLVAEAQYNLERYGEAAELLTTLANRQDIPMGRRIEARVQQGVCELETGSSEKAEATLRKALSEYQALSDKDEVDDYFPAQAHFFVGEIYRQYYEAVKLDLSKSTEAFWDDLNYKSELLLSAKGHYMRAVRMRNGHWATASGARIGEMYETLYDYLANLPVPPELTSEQAQVYRQMVLKDEKMHTLLTNAIDAYEQTLEAAEKLGAKNAFVDRTRESLRKVRELLLADADADSEQEAAPPPEPKPKPHS